MKITVIYVLCGYYFYIAIKALTFIGMRKVISISLITTTYCVEPKFDNRSIIEFIDLGSNWKAVLFFISILFIPLPGTRIHVCILEDHSRQFTPIYITSKPVPLTTKCFL